MNDRITKLILCALIVNGAHLHPLCAINRTNSAKNALTSSTQNSLKTTDNSESKSLFARHISGEFNSIKTQADISSPIQSLQNTLITPNQNRQPKTKKTTLPATPSKNLLVQGPPTPEKKEAKIPNNLQNEEPDTIELHFENADLQNFVSQIEDFFDVTFIADDSISPLPADVKSLKGNKITFRTNDPLSREKAWDLFVTFLYISGFAIVPTADPKFYKISPIEQAQKAPTPTFIGVDHTLLPDNDQLIRYVYFIANSTIEAIGPVVNMLKSKEAPAITLQDAKAILLIDKAYNVKKLMEIVKELDKVTMPQEMVILKLKRVDAKDVEALYKNLTEGDKKDFARFFTARKQPTSMYFPENARIIAEPRTNTLILLGPQDALKKIEEFIVKYVDVELEQPYSPLHTYQLKYADASTVAKIMNDLTKFGQSTEAGKHGGVRGTDKYLGTMHFTPEAITNQLIVQGDYEDFLQVEEIIARLDEPQEQVAIEVLLLGVTLNDTKEFGTQIRSKDNGANGLLGNNVKFQTSGFLWNGAKQGIVENTEGSGVQRLLGDLIKLVAGGRSPGSTVLTMGLDKYGIWGIFKILQTLTSTQIIANPFVTTTNNTPAQVKVGTTKRIPTGQVIGGTTTNAFGDDSAMLELNITPLINSDGKIVLTIDIQINEFGDSIGENDTKTNRQVKTSAVVANREVLALGGLIKTTTNEETTKVPVLGNIPIIGWLFKNKQKTQTKDNLLVLISCQIIRPDAPEDMQRINNMHLQDFDETIKRIASEATPNDPINKLFFAPGKEDTEQVFEDYTKKQLGYTFDKKKKSKKTSARGRRLAKRKQTQPQKTEAFA